MRRKKIAISAISWLVVDHIANRIAQANAKQQALLKGARKAVEALADRAARWGSKSHKELLEFQ